MKKWMAMALALCMLCGMVNVATAEEYQTVSTSLGNFDIPGHLWHEPVEFWYDAGDMLGVNVCDYNNYNYQILVYLNPQSVSMDQEEAFRRQGYCDPETPVNYEEWGLPDNEPVISYQWDDTLYIFTHSYPWAFVNINMTAYNSEGYVDALEIVKCIFLSLSEPAAKETVSVSKQPLTIGRASFEVDADLEIVQMGDYQWMLMNDQYAVVFYYYEYGEDNIDFTDGDMQIDNCFFINYMATDDQQTALKTCYLAQRKDIGMPGGDDVLCFAINGIAMLCHYYPNMGFMMMAQCQDGSLSDDELMAIVEEIALSFRVDGMTAEEMDEYKAQKEGELAAAIAEAERIAAEEAARQRVYITAANGANIRSGPDASHSRVAYGSQGDSFPFLGEENGWYKIDVNGQTGYVSKGLGEVK